MCYRLLKRSVGWVSDSTTNTRRLLRSSEFSCNEVLQFNFSFYHAQDWNMSSAPHIFLKLIILCGWLRTFQERGLIRTIRSKLKELLMKVVLLKEQWWVSWRKSYSFFGFHEKNTAGKTSSNNCKRRIFSLVFKTGICTWRENNVNFFPRKRTKLSEQNSQVEKYLCKGTACLRYSTKWNKIRK